MNADRHAAFLVRLCAAALHEAECPKPDFEPDSSFFIKLIHAHHLSGLLYPLIKDTDFLTESAMEALRRDFRADQMRDLAQEDALEEITEAFSEAGIRFMVLKGIIMKRLYRKSYHRMMGDLDLFIHEEDRQRSREVMESLGYETMLYEELYDDVYYRRPFLNVEMHVALGEDGDSAHPYFDGIWDRAVQDTECPVRYEMSSLDYYLYFIQHAVKHCKFHGTGIRTLIDFWVVRRTLLPTLDSKAVEAALTEFGSLKFEREFYDLAEVWFDGKAGDSFQNESMRRFLILEAGLYGNESNNVFHFVVSDADAQKAQAKKRKFFWSNVFPSRERMAVKYPVLNRHAYLLPVCWLIRAVKALLQPQKIRKEARLYAEVTGGMDLHTEMRARFGFLSSSGSDEHGAE